MPSGTLCVAGLQTHAATRTQIGVLEPGEDPRMEPLELKDMQIQRALLKV